MFGNKTPELREPNLSSEFSPYNGMTKKTGSVSGSSHGLINCFKYPRIFVFKVIGLCEQSRRTLVDQLEWSELVTCFGANLEQVSQGALGTKRDWTLTVRIPGASSGTVTMMKNMLSSTNLEEESMSHIYSDGRIVIQYGWRSKAVVSRYGPPPCGLRPISVLGNGTRN